MLQDIIKTYEDKRYRDLIKKSLEKEIFTIFIKQLLHLNKSKFEDTYLLKLNNIIKKIYDKNIEYEKEKKRRDNNSNNIMLPSIKGGKESNNNNNH